MNLNGLAKTYDAYGGELVLHFMPYHTIMTKIAHTRMNDAHGEDLDVNASAYVSIIGCWVDCQLGVDEDDLSAEARGLYWFWNNRVGKVVEDYELFITSLQDGYGERVE